MARRKIFNSLLKEVLGSDNVYYQPPESVKLKYPAIVYFKNNVHINHADNVPYTKKTRYSVTYIGSDPDSDIPEKISEIPTATFDNSFTADYLHHEVYSIYF